MKRAKTHIILFMAVTITVLYTVYIAFHNSAERVNTQIDHAFKSAITEDYNERLAYISYYHPEPTNWDIKMYTIAPSLHQKVKSYTIRTRQGKTIYTFKDSLDEQTAKRMLNQYEKQNHRRAHSDKQDGSLAPRHILRKRWRDDVVDEFLHIDVADKHACRHHQKGDAHYDNLPAVIFEKVFQKTGKRTLFGGLHIALIFHCGSLFHCASPPSSLSEWRVCDS